MRTGGLFSSLYWKMAGIFLLILTLLAFAYMYLTAKSAKVYFDATHQRLNREVASHIAKFIPPFMNGMLYRTEAEKIFFNAMVMNPSMEVYLLNPEGKILSYHSPDNKIKRTQVTLAPIHQFISTEGNVFLVGDDPKNERGQKIFSAAEVRENGLLRGYIYAVLASEEYDSVLELLLQSHVLRLSREAMLITLGAALATGLLAFWLITRNLNRIIRTVEQFRSGDLNARIRVQSSGEMTALAHTFNDMADTLASNLAQLQTAERLRRELIANVSHDLRTPIAVAHGYAETLRIKQDTLGAAERNRYAEYILQSTNKLKRLVDELFELSKLEAQENQPHLERFNFSELVQDVSANFRILAQQKHIALTCQLSEKPALVYADIGMMDRVLQNLLDNAIQYTPEGGNITIQLQRTADSIEVSVADTGPGIPADVLPYLFMRYHKQNGNERSARPSGMGLGLVIVKKILEFHQSDISVQTQPNQGTRFSFRLPLAMS